jgi:hypothetical protein
MSDFHWSPSEKKLARELFDQALSTELAQRLAEFKAKSAAASSAEDMWSLRSYLEDSEREIQRKYDYRYSRLLIVFAELLREGRVTREQLAGLHAEKQAYIDRIACL